MNGNDAPLYPFHIFYLDHRFALMQGDPCLGKIEAATQEEAEREAISQGLGSGHTIVVTHIPDNGVSYRDTKTEELVQSSPFLAQPSGIHSDFSMHRVDQDRLKSSAWCSSCVSNKWKLSVSVSRIGSHTASAWRKRGVC